jgi:uncharacterized protein (TIGR04255 family)
MSLTFAKPPLVELIAELRWDALHAQLGQQPAPFNSIPLLIGGSSHEQFYRAFGEALYQSGFHISERLIPLGFPSPAFTVVYRYRNENEKQHILQVGPSVLSANAVPPYRSWTEFRPCVARGVEALLSTRPEEARDAPFTGVLLRYIDLFDSELIERFGEPAFIRDVLGLNLVFSDAVKEAIPNADAAKFSLMVATDIGDGMNLKFSVGESNIGGKSGLLLDTTVSSTQMTAPDLGVVLDKLDRAHAVIHDLFVRMTRPIHDLMEPIGAD